MQTIDLRLCVLVSPPLLVLQILEKHLRNIKLFYPKLFKKISYDCKQIWNLLQFRVIFIILKLDICSFVSLLFIYSSRVSYIYILDIPPGFSLYILFRYPSRVSSIYIYFLDIPPGFPLYICILFRYPSRGVSLCILFRYPSRVSSMYKYCLDIPPGFPLYSYCLDIPPGFPLYINIV